MYSGFHGRLYPVVFAGRDSGSGTLPRATHSSGDSGKCIYLQITSPQKGRRRAATPCKNSSG